MYKEVLLATGLFIGAQVAPGDTGEAFNVYQVINNFQTKLGCAVTTVEVTIEAVHEHPERYGEALPGKIIFNSLITNGLTNDQMETLTYHEVAHACMPEDEEYLLEPAVLPDYTETITRFHGFNLRVNTKFPEFDREYEYYFTRIEEAAAEILAEYMSPDTFDSIKDRGVKEAWHKTLQDKLDEASITPEELNELRLKNDVKGLVKRLNKTDTFRSRDLQALLDDIGFEGTRKVTP